MESKLALVAATWGDRDGARPGAPDPEDRRAPQLAEHLGRLLPRALRGLPALARVRDRRRQLRADRPERGPALVIVATIAVALRYRRAPDPGSGEAFSEELRPALGAAGDGTGPWRRRSRPRPGRGRGSRRSARRLPFSGTVGAELQVGEHELVALAEQVVDPVAWRVHLEPISRVRRDEGAASAPLLYRQVPARRALEHGCEVVLVVIAMPSDRAAGSASAPAGARR